MFDLTITDIVTIVVALFGGGVIGVAIKAFTEKRKVNAEADSMSIKSLLEIDQRMNERMAKLEERIARLEQENYMLKSDKLELEKETHKLETMVLKLETENKELYTENCELKSKLAMLDNEEKEDK